MPLSFKVPVPPRREPKDEVRSYPPAGIADCATRAVPAPPSPRTAFSPWREKSRKPKRFCWVGHSHHRLSKLPELLTMKILKEEINQHAT